MLEELDWKKVRIEPQLAKISTPDMDYFQLANTCRLDQDIQVSPGKGCLILIRQGQIVVSD